MSNRNNNSLFYYLFPILGLTADVFLIIYRGWPPIIFTIAAVVGLGVPIGVMYAGLKKSDDGTDDLIKGCMILATVVPFLIIGLGTSDLF